MTTEDKEQNRKELSYRQSGVDVEAGYALVDKIKPFVEKTKRPEILSGLGSFSALSRIPKHIKNPILVTCTDGVGTKIEIAKELNNFDSIGVGDEAGTITLVKKYDEISGKVGVSYNYSEDIMFYASYSEGFQSGGFFGRNQNAADFKNTYDPEYAKTLELGMKSLLVDKRLQLNIAAFRMISKISKKILLN